MSNIVENKYVAEAVDGYGKRLYRVFLQRQGCEPSESFARQCLRLFVRKVFSVRIRPATEKDLS